ncbi:MAG: hypothetical protein ACREI2_07670 [Nitrospiraceae bacterium]
MSYELIGILILGISQVTGLLILGIYLSRELQEQLRRNLALETQFQKWNADQFGNVSQRLDQVLTMLRTHQA